MKYFESNRLTTKEVIQRNELSPEEPGQRSEYKISEVFQQTPPESPTEKIALPGSKNRSIRRSQFADPKTPEAPRQIEGAILMTTETKRAPALGVKGVDSVSTPL
jgi:hypothetical protein